MAMGTAQDTANPRAHGELWAFSLRVYGAPGVESACLDLQRRHRLDVNLLLAACWLGASGRGTASTADWRRLQARTAQWQAQIVARLRAVRQALKAGGAGDEACAALRQAVAGCELEAEHIEQGTLEAALSPAPEAPKKDPSMRVQDAARNLCTLLRVCGCPFEGERPHLRVLLEASFPGMPPAAVGEVLEQVLSTAG